MKKVMILALCVLSAVSCIHFRIGNELVSGGNSLKGTGDSAVASYELPDFDSVEISLHADVDFIQTDEGNSVEIRAQENLLEHLNFKVEDGCLKVCFDDGIKANYRDMDIVIRGRSLSALTVRGAADVDIMDGLKADNFDLLIQGAGDSDIVGLDAAKVSITVQGAADISVDDLKCDDLSALIQGAGDIKLNGEARNASLTIHGAGDINASGLLTESVSKSVSGAGSIRL